MITIEKRKDSKNRILRKGEYQRKNGSYEYRYTDAWGERQSVYAKTLDELRKEEAEINRDELDGINRRAGDISVNELLELYLKTKLKLKANSKRAYSTPINRINESKLGKMSVRNIKISDAKEFFIDLHNDGLKRNTIQVYMNVLHPAFEMAVDDDMIRKNPFKFKLTDLLPNDKKERVALSKSQQKEFFEYALKCGNKDYYNEMILLLETGLRVSELYGLTKQDINFDKRCINVNHQLCRTGDKPYFITSTKSKSGNRVIPMSQIAYDTLNDVIKNRKSPKIEYMVDGYSGFLFLDRAGKPKVAMHLQGYMRRIHKKYQKQHNIPPFKVTPHVLRHTFCTNMQQAGLDVKTLQYIMGHSNSSVTLDVYTHTDVDSVINAFEAVASV